MDVISLSALQSANQTAKKLDELNKTIILFDGYCYSAKPEANTTTTQLYLSTVFDTANISLQETDMYRIEFEYYTESQNLNMVGYKLFLNNTENTDVITGGFVGASNTSTRPVIKNTIQYYTGVWGTKTYDKSFRYVKPVISFEFNKKLLDTIYIRNIRCFVGNTELPIVGIGKLLTEKADLIQVTHLPVSAGSVSNGVDVISSPGSSTDPIFIEYLYDTIGLNFLENDDVSISYDYFTSDNNITKTGIDIWWNDSSTVGQITGGASSKDRNQIVQVNKTGHCQKTFPYRKTYRYMHVLISATLKTQQMSTFSIKDISLTVKGKEIRPIDRGLVFQNGLSLLKPLVTWVNTIITGASLQGVMNSMKLNNVYPWKDATINVLGDSITQGFGATIPYHSYFNELMGAGQVRNYGVSSTRIAKQSDDNNQSLSARFSSMNNSADLIVVFGGTNDFGHGTATLGTPTDRTPTTFYGAVHTLMSGLIEKYQGKYIVFITPLPRNASGTESKTNKQGYTLKEYVNIIIEVAEFYSIPVLDLYRNSGIYVDSATIRTKMIPDGLHPNDTGHQFLARKIAAFLNSKF